MACIQESKLCDTSRSPSFPNYSVVRLDRAGGGGGLLTLLHHSIAYSPLVSTINDGITEVILINAKIAGSSINIANVYIPPASSTNIPPNFRASLAPLLSSGDTIVLGDVNGHNEEWSCGTSDARGDFLAGEVDNNNYSILNNPDIATRPCSDSSPDVVFAPTPWALSFDWSVSTTLNSDHLPISLAIDGDSTPVRGGRTSFNFRKADWDAFTRETEEAFSRLPPPSTCRKGEGRWRRVLQKCSAHHVPAGFHRTFVPGLDAASAALID